MRISYSFGVMDLIHIGHIKALEEAKRHADKHIFGLIKNEAALQWYGQILSDYEERKKTLENIVLIDEIMPQSTFDPSKNLIILREKYPSAEIVLYHGKNWALLPEKEFLETYNIKVITLPYTDKLSYSNILKSFSERENSHNFKSRNSLISTKANTLLALQKYLKKSKIEDILVTTKLSFDKDKMAFFAKLNEIFNGDTIVIRSSSSSEDGFEKSNAGFYESVLDVDSTNEQAVEQAIETVYQSYKKSNQNTDVSNEQILIQRQTKNIAICGVVFTRDIQQNRPYYLINYDNDGGSNSVTSGAGGKSIYIAKNIKTEDVAPEYKKLFASIKEIEELLEGMILDIEFAVLKDDSIVIFQVRPLAAAYKYHKTINDEDFFEILNTEKERYKKLKDAYTHKNMLLSDMAFWNPAEIIGEAPKKLSFSLYKDIITANAWNEGLRPMGYCAVPYNLMYQIGNKPYISLEYSFRSLIPASLNEGLKKKLINYYINKLKANPTAHDKIEFEITYSCYDFAIVEKTKELKNYGFSDDEIKNINEALFEQTNQAINNFFDVLAEDTKDTIEGELIYTSIKQQINNNNLTIFQIQSYFRTLLKILKLKATPHFARQARYAFIAKSFCKSLVSEGYFTNQEINDFMLSVETVASDFKRDIERYLNGVMSKSDFNLKYGHLRSGTYDITAPRYDAINFSQSKMPKILEAKNKTANLDAEKIQTILNKYGFTLPADKFIQFMKTAFEERERFKFNFTKILSLAIELLARIGEKLGFTREEVSFIDVLDVYASEYYKNENDLEDFWKTLIEQRKKVYNRNNQLVLPDIITSVADLEMIKISEMRPNFITTKSSEGNLVFLEKENTMDIDGKIICVTRADPGFDWIFSKQIKGLITMYGGAASHMAIRCAEFGLPAAIGCGEKIYKSLDGVSAVKLDCKNEKIIFKDVVACGL